MMRSHRCGDLRETDLGSPVTLCGWVHSRRDHGGVTFIDLRDTAGIVQVVFSPESSAEAHETAQELRGEFCARVHGEVRARPEGTVNDKLPTGQVEVAAQGLEILSPADTPPFQVAEHAEVDETLRLRYRYLDLRRPSMQANLRLRHAIIAAIRRFLDGEGFVEVETPMLTRATPEGARDYLVPSRVHPGRFYALPQSPQIFKQLLMVAGFDRYYQIARCFRDEDARADRSPGEFYQLDFEMSYVTQEDVFQAIEPVLGGVFEEFANGREVTRTGEWPRIPYKEAMLEFGSDKPDLRNPLRIAEVTGHFTKSGFGLFEKIAGSGGVVRAIPAPATAEKSRKFFDDMND